MLKCTSKNTGEVPVKIWAISDKMIKALIYLNIETFCVFFQ